jgi:hypothetical protein
MIILLGPDNTGKSTLAKQLINESGNVLNSIHCTQHTEFEEYYNWLAVPSTLGVTVFDRWFFCDIPYAKIVRKEETSKYSYQEIHILNALTKLYKPLIILCTNQAPNFDDREQLSTSEQHYDLLQDYKRVLTVLQQPYTVFDWEYSQLSTFDLLERHMNERPSWPTTAMNTPV